MSPAAHHLYVHVPFCRLVCAYCDFVTVGGRAQDIPRYSAALAREMKARSAPGELRTIYFGGGTPSVLSAETVAGLVAAARDRWRHEAIEEVTLEANPSRREAPDWEALRAAGVTRLSLGVQSLRDDDLVTLARGHSAAEGRAAFVAARAAGFDNISIDLIYGIPRQSVDAWADGLAAAVELAPDHVSCYALQLALAPDEWAAPPRPGALRWRARVAALQEDDVAADQYRVAERMLDEAGYRHYEISSWALPGSESRHNAAYWARRAYTGIGAGAHSYDGAAHRSWNVRDLDDYLARAEAGERPVAGAEELDEAARSFEAVALGLRTLGGVRRTGFAGEFGVDPVRRYAGAIDESVGAGLVEVDDDAVRLTARGRLFATEALLPFVGVRVEDRAPVAGPRSR